jgi:hypothetical protein
MNAACPDKAKVLLLLVAALSCDASQGATRAQSDPLQPAESPGATAGAGAAERPGATVVGDAAPHTGLACTEPVSLGFLPTGLRELSGLAPASVRGQWWAHNDSEHPAALYRINARGEIVQRVRIPGVRLTDLEDMAAARCASGTCLYLADIGDNLHQRRDRRILRLREPAARDTAVSEYEVFPFTYPEGPSDAEALFVLPGERIFIVTKGRNRPAALYRYPGQLRPSPVVLEPVRVLGDGLAQIPDMVTGASATRDGHHVAIRTYTYVDLFRVHDGTLVHAARIELGKLAERQGEAVAVRDGGELVLASEAGPGRSAGLIARARCVLP